MRKKGEKESPLSGVDYNYQHKEIILQSNNVKEATMARKKEKFQ